MNPNPNPTLVHTLLGIIELGTTELGTTKSKH